MTYYIGPEGPRDATLAIVAEKPGRDELTNLQLTGTGRPLIGASGRALDRHLKRVGTDRSAVWLTNAVQTFDHLGNPSILDIKREQVRLYRELDSLPNLNCVVALGGAALLSLSNFNQSDILRRRGSILRSFTNLKCIPTLHPAFYMRGEWRYQSVVEFDLKRAVDESATRAFTLPQRTYYVEPTFAQALEWLDSMRDAPWVSFDIETHRPNWIACIAFARDPSEAFCIPIMHGNRSSYWHDVREERLVWRKIQEVLSQPRTRYVTQNGLFDCWHLWRHGIETPYMDTGFDTMYAHRVIAPDLPHGLHFLVSIYTREPYYKDESGRWDDMPNTPDRQFWTYNCKDAACTLEVALAQIEDMQELALYDLYMKGRQAKFTALLNMRKGGMKVDVGRLEEIRSRLHTDRQLLDEQIQTDLGWTPNTRSYIDMGKLFTELKVSYQQTPTGRPKSNEESMVQYIHRASLQPGATAAKAARVLQACLDITEKRTLESGFMNIALDARDFYHPSYDMGKAKSGRDQSEGADEGGPQIMNIPRPIRIAFVADEHPSPEWEVTQADLKQAEARITAYMASDLFLIKAFESGHDVYCINACKIYGNWTDPLALPPLDMIARYKGTEERKRSKVASLAFDYLMSPRKFCRVQAKDGIHFSESEATRLQNIILSDAKRRYHELVAQQLRESAWLTNAVGVRREFYGLFDDAMIREALSWLSQSVVAWLDSLAKIHLDRELPKVGARLMTTTHDSATISNRIDRRPDVEKIIHEAYNHPLTIHNRRLLIPVDITHGPSWGEQA